MGLVLVTPPAEEPVSLAEAKLHLRVDVEQTVEDALISSLIKAARFHAERETGRALVTQTWRLVLDEFPEWRQELPHPPLQSAASITYIDTNGDSQTLTSAGSDYRVLRSSIPGYIEPPYNGEWPATYDVSEAVQITFVAGYGAASAVPDDIKAAIKLIVGHLYMNREAVSTAGLSEVPMAATALLQANWTGSYMGVG